MKVIKKITAIMLSIMMVLGMSSVVSAAETSGTYNDDIGSITINAAIKDHPYTIYRILQLESFSGDDTNLENGNYAYKVETGWDGFVNDTAKGGKYLEKDADGYVTWKTGADEKKFAKEALEYAKTLMTSGSYKNTQTTTTNTLTFSGLKLGYYLVDSSVGSLCFLGTTNKDVTIVEKNGGIPKLDKEVKEDSTNGWKSDNTADIGQTVEFQVTIYAKTGAENYVLHDVMSEGLTFNNNSVKIVKKTGENESDLTKDTEYTLNTPGTESADPKCTFEVVFKQSFCNTLANDDQIIVTYSATLNKDAVVAGEGNANTAKLEYGNKNFTTPIITKTKTYEIPVFKYTNKNGTDTALAGAVFELYRDVNCTSKIEFINKGKDITTNYDCYRIKIGSESSSVDQITTSADGKFKISGLDADTYYLKEVTAPKGYNKPLTPTEIKIDSDGNICVNGSTTANIGDVKILNKSGSLLPSTGGRGTTLFYILGAILVVGSGVVLITKKRMK